MYDLFTTGNINNNEWVFGIRSQDDEDFEWRPVTVYKKDKLLETIQLRKSSNDHHKPQRRILEKLLTPQGENTSIS